MRGKAPAIKKQNHLAAPSQRMAHGRFQTGAEAIPLDHRDVGKTALGDFGARHFDELDAAIEPDRGLAGGRRATTTVRLGRIQRSGDAPIVTDGPFVEAKEAVGSYAVVEVKDRDEAIAIAKSWPAGGLVEVRPIDE